MTQPCARKIGAVRSACVAMTDDLANARRRQLRRFMNARGLQPASWAKKAGVRASAIYNFFNGRSNSLRQDTVEKLAAAANVPISQIFGDGLIPLAQPTQNIVIMGMLGAGVWQANYDWPAKDRYVISVPRFDEIYRRAYGLLVNDDHADQLYPEGSVVFVVNTEEAGISLKSNDIVICHRVDATGDVERTIKEFVIGDDATGWLWPRSSNPKHQQPIPYTEGGAPDAPSTSGVSVHVGALVIGAIVKRR